MKKIGIYLLAGTLILSIGLLTGCQHETDTMAPPTSVITIPTVVPESTQSIMDEFYDLMRITTNENEIYQFIKSNISNVSSSEVDTMIKSLMGYIGDIKKVDYNDLIPYKDYMGDEMLDFVELMSEEQSIPSIKNEMIQIPLSELLERVLEFEEHLDNYPNGITTKESIKLYHELITEAIVGGYDKDTNKPHFYIAKDNKRIDNHTVDTYINFAINNANTKSGEILSEYVKLLNKNDRYLNESIERFYQKLDTIIMDKFNVL